MNMESKVLFVRNQETDKAPCIYRDIRVGQMWYQSIIE